MTAERWFKSASIAAVVQGLAHATMVLTYRAAHGPVELAVLDAMRRNYFSFAGSARSYWDFYLGYSMMSAYTCLIEGALAWQLGRLARRDPESGRGIALVLIAFNAGHAALAMKYFFPLPATFDALVLALLAGGMLAGRPHGQSAQPLA